MNHKNIGTIMLLLAAMGGFYVWAESVSEVGKLNRQAIIHIEKREDDHRETHRDEHSVFRQEYREDQASIEAKLDKLLERLQ